MDKGEVFIEPNGGAHPALTIKVEKGFAPDHTVVFTLPLVRIAEKLGGVRSIPRGQELPPGIWIADGFTEGAAYDYIELIDKLTARLAVAAERKPDSSDALLLHDTFLKPFPGSHRQIARPWPEEKPSLIKRLKARMFKKKG